MVSSPTSTSRTRQTEPVASRIGLVLDCEDPVALAGFWGPALGYTSLGEHGSYVVLVEPDDAEPRLLLQRVPEAKAAKNRVHFDVHVPDIEAEAERLAGLGATRIDESPLDEFDTRWVRMTDPEGNEFCVCEG